MGKSVSEYRLEKDGSFVIENYNSARPFSSFFPGIAGLFGIPLWAFYVNRGQCMSSIGIRSKDEAIFEFLPANKAYQLTSTQGFRTFIKVKGKKEDRCYEPFSLAQKHHDRGIKNRMIIYPYELTIEESNPSLGLNVRVEYFPVPNAPYAGLARKLTIENTSSKNLDIEFLDGASVILPTGINNWFLKEMSRTIEAWMTVEDIEKGFPLFKLSTDPRDTAQVAFVKGANFYTGFADGSSIAATKVIVDPALVFGSATDLSFPEKFLSSSFAYPRRQISNNKTPCAFAFVKAKLKAKAKKSFTSMIGHVFDCAHIEKYRLRAIDQEFIERKRRENRELINGIMDRIFTASASPLFDMYARQTYLDNVLRGGLPYSVSVNGSSRCVYVFSRKHGDPERDYNRFMVSPTYFSEGEGNYRDVNQNRRCDVFFNPQVGEKNIVDFMNLIQLDGYNPLVFKGEKFILSPEDFKRSTLAKNFCEKDAKKISHILSKPFSVGDILHYLEDNKISFPCSKEDFVKQLLCFAVATQEAVHGEGFWSDHWTYNTDLLESFRGIYPDRLRWLLIEKNDFTYFDTHAFVRPRTERYSFQHGEVRQYHSIEISEEKNILIQKRHEEKHCVRLQGGEGAVFKTVLLTKLISLALNKLATLDPYGVGIEMEAEKPNWYDALNGLPGLLGSSLSETLELKRLFVLLQEVITEAGIHSSHEVDFFAELWEFFTAMADLLARPVSAYDFWNSANDFKEVYRLKVRRGVRGETRKVSVGVIGEFIDLALRKLDAGIQKGSDSRSGCYTTYFSYRVSKYETLTNAAGRPAIKAQAFEQNKLPLFLEGFVHALRTENIGARAIYQAVKKSPLFDKKLKMYKVNAPLEKESFELGRCKAFTPGWLENESIWLHMEYKFLLELLKNDLTEDFYKEFFQVLIPFQKPQVYGRSVLENSSFLVSSAHPDEALHGGGFVARLSGSTAEFIHMWLLMNVGSRPFSVDKRRGLCLRFSPALSSKFFTKTNCQRRLQRSSGEEFVVDIPAKSYGFLFLGSILVVYANPKGKNTFGPGGVRPVRMILSGKDGVLAQIEGDVVPMPFSGMVRERQVDRIEILLG